MIQWFRFPLIIQQVFIVSMPVTILGIYASGEHNGRGLRTHGSCSLVEKADVKIQLHKQFTYYVKSAIAMGTYNKEPSGRSGKAF